MTHTPGPWTVKGDADGDEWGYYYIDDINAHLNSLDDLNSSSIPQQDCIDEANARLIASAPELLGALEGIVRDWEQGDDPLMYLEATKATIAKATGQEPTP